MIFALFVALNLLALGLTWMQSVDSVAVIYLLGAMQASLYWAPWYHDERCQRRG